MHHVAGLCASLSCAAASRHEPDQVRHQGVFQTDPPATCRVSSGQLHGTHSGHHFTSSLFAQPYLLDCSADLMFPCDVGVPAGGGAPASSDPPPPGSPAANRHAAAPLQGHPGEEALC